MEAIQRRLSYLKSAGYARYFNFVRFQAFRELGFDAADLALVRPEGLLDLRDVFLDGSDVVIAAGADGI